MAALAGEAAEAFKIKVLAAVAGEAAEALKIKVLAASAGEAAEARGRKFMRNPIRSLALRRHCSLVSESPTATARTGRLSKQHK